MARFAAFVINGGKEQQLERTICVTSYDYSLKLACKLYGPMYVIRPLGVN